MEYCRVATDSDSGVIDTPQFKLLVQVESNHDDHAPARASFGSEPRAAVEQLEIVISQNVLRFDNFHSGLRPAGPGRAEPEAQAGL